VHDLDDKQAVTAIQTLEELRGVRLTEPRVTTVLLVAFAILSLVITSAGLIGIVGQSVTQRSTEIGIRVALGAEAGHVLWSVMRGTVGLVAVGVAIGLGAATLTTRVISGLLFQLEPTDALTYGGVALVLVAVAIAACLIPARRALLVQPIEALRAR
jgi:ABC-type antimicrobial peptide transport system permease subunit